MRIENLCLAHYWEAMDEVAEQLVKQHDGDCMAAALDWESRRNLLAEHDYNDWINQMRIFCTMLKFQETENIDEAWQELLDDLMQEGNIANIDSVSNLVGEIVFYDMNLCVEHKLNLLVKEQQQKEVIA